MATFPARTEISDTGSNPTNAVARTGFGRLWDWVNEVLGMWITAGGTGDAITATYSPAVVLVDGLVCSVRATAANTITNPTFSPNGLTARTIYMNGGNALAVGSIAGANHELKLKYYAASTRWELLNPAVTATTLGAALRAGSNFTGGVNTAKTTVASATTPDIFATAVGNVIDYTGTVTCTGFVAAPQAGVTRTLICAGAAPFTAGANLAIDGTPSGTLTVTAGDVLEVTAITTTTFRIREANYAKKDVVQSFNVAQRGAVTNNGSSLSFDLNTSNHFKCSVSSSSAITFTNIPTGQTGTILFVQTGAAAPTLAGTTHMDATDLATLGTAGTYLVSYAAMDGTNVECVVSRKLA